MAVKNAHEVLRNTFEKLDQILEERRGDDMSKTEEKTGRCRKKTMHDRKRVERDPNEK
jgi:hypothetical protein